MKVSATTEEYYKQLMVEGFDFGVFLGLAALVAEFETTLGLEAILLWLQVNE